MAHPLSDAMVGMTPEERAAYKATAYRDFPNALGRTFTKGPAVVTILEVPVLENGLLKLVLGLTLNGVEQDLSGFNPLYVRNPPILVDDPAGDIVRTWTTQELNTTTRLMEDVVYTRVLAEDRLRALKAIVIDALKAFIQ
jgi:hypothetical protein